MKTSMLRRSSYRSQQGSILLIALIVAALLVPLILATVYMASVQQRTVALSQSWNSSIPAVEAGIEEAFAHLNTDCLIEDTAQWTANGWSQSSTQTDLFYAPRRYFPDGSYYDVSIVTNSGGASVANPIIICKGSISTRFGLRHFTNEVLYVPSGGPQFATVSGGGNWEVERGTNTFIKRQVRVKTKRASWANFGLLGFGNVGVSGTVRSFDSAGASSYWGHYLPSLAEDDAVIGSLHSDISLHSNADIYGNLQTSAVGNVGGGGSVGDETWVDGGNSGIQPGHYDNDLDLPDPAIPESPSVSDMQAWPSLSACSGKCTETFVLPSLTNGAWITTTDCPPNALTGYMMPPGGTIVTNTNNITTSTTYYASGTPPGPPIATNIFNNLTTNTASSLAGVPGGANIIGTNYPSPAWATNWAPSRSAPAQSPTAGTYLTSPVGTPNGYNYIASPGVFVFLNTTNYDMPNCCTVFPATNDFYSGTMTGVRQVSSPNCCITTAIVPTNMTIITATYVTNYNGNSKNISSIQTNYTTNVVTSITNATVDYTTNFTYNHIQRKVYQTPATTNYTYTISGSTNYVYNITTYSYYGPQTNNLTVTEDYKYVTSGGDVQINSISLSGQSMMLIKGGHNRIYVPNGFSLSGQAKVVIEPGSSVEFFMGGSVDVSGNGIDNTGDKASNLMIYGLPTCTSISLSGNAKFTGAILAPSADLTINGGGSRGLIVGAITAKTITMHGNPVDFVYDQDVRRHVVAYFTATEWKEEVPTP